MEEQIRQTQIEFFFNKNVEIYLKLKNGFFYIGKILDINSDKKFIILKDRKLGEMPVMFEDISAIEPRKEKEDINI